MRLGSTSGTARITAGRLAAAAAVVGLAASACSGSPAPKPAAAPTAQKVAQALRTCQAADLNVQTGKSTQQGTASATQTIDMTNTSNDTCAVDGYAGVNLVGIAKGTTAYSWVLNWNSTPYTPVTLHPGGAAHFTVVYAPGGPSTANIQVTQILLTVPNTTATMQLNWTPTMLLQDHVAHPATYVTPVVPGI